MEGVRAALQGGVDVNTKDENGWTGLMLAILFNHNSVVEILLSKPDIDVNLKANDGFCALSWAVFKQNNEALKMLMNFPGIDVNVVVHRETIVYRALIHQKIEGLKILLSHPGIDVNVVVNGETLVYRALRHQKSLKMVRHQKDLKILRHQEGLKMLLSHPGLTSHTLNQLGSEVMKNCYESWGEELKDLALLGVHIDITDEARKKLLPPYSTNRKKLEEVHFRRARFCCKVLKVIDEAKQKRQGQ